MLQLVRVAMAVAVLAITAMESRSVGLSLGDVAPVTALYLGATAAAELEWRP
jgi:hypothetical protein